MFKLVYDVISATSFMNEKVCHETMDYIKKKEGLPLYRFKLTSFQKLNVLEVYDNGILVGYAKVDYTKSVPNYQTIPGQLVEVKFSDCRDLVKYV